MTAEGAEHGVGDVVVVLTCNCGWTCGILRNGEASAAEEEAARQWRVHADAETVAERYERERLDAYVAARRAGRDDIASGEVWPDGEIETNNLGRLEHGTD